MWMWWYKRYGQRGIPAPVYLHWIGLDCHNVGVLLRTQLLLDICVLYIHYAFVLCMNEVNPHRARLVPGWVTRPSSSGYRPTISVCNQPTGSTQPCIPPGSLFRAPTSDGVRAGIALTEEWPLCDPIWHVSSRSGEACCYLLLLRLPLPLQGLPLYMQV